MTKIKDVFKETFSKENLKVIEHGKSKTFYKNDRLTKEQLKDLKEGLENDRKERFKIIYETNPATMIEISPVKDYILIEGEYCTWNEEALNKLPDDWLYTIYKICENYSNIT